MKHSMNFSRLCALLFLSSASLFALGCNPEGMKYVSGPDDPSLTVTKEDLAQVHQVLDLQEQRDIEAGIRSERAARFADEHVHEEGDGHDHGEQPTATAALPVAPSVSPGAVALGFLEATLPEGWTSGTPSSPMRLAEIAIADPGGRFRDAELVAFYFGPDQGGSVQANLDRWFSQMQQPDGRASSEVADVEELNVAGMKAVIVDIPGTYAPGAMPGQAAQPPREQWHLTGAIVETERGPVFLKSTGPDATLIASREAFGEFVRSIRIPEEIVAPVRQRAVPTPDRSASAPGSPIDLQVLTGTLPPGWRAETPASTMRVAQASIPAAAGDAEDASLVVFYFGPGQGGGVEENIQRWLGQITQRDGRPSSEVATRSTLDANGMNVTIVEASGAYAGMARPGQTASAKEGQRLLGAIIDSPQGLVFLRVTGPEATVAANRDAMLGFLKTLRAK